MENARPTIKEIARRLKVSTSTVSRALHNHPSIGLVTTERVHKIASELNFVPNQNAIYFKQRKTYSIGVILPDLSEAFFSSAISGIEDHAIRNNYNLIIGQSLDDPQREQHILENMKNNRVDGMIVSISKNTVCYDHFNGLEKCGIPIVFFDCVPEMEHIHRITCDLETGMLEAIRKLVVNGCHAIGLINGPGHLLASKERLKSYREGLRQNNLEAKEGFIANTDLSSAGNCEAMHQLLTLEGKPDAVIAFNDYVTLDAMNIAKQYNLKVNKEISFVSFANLAIWAHIDQPPLASLEQFPYKQGDKAMEILLRILKEDQNMVKEPFYHQVVFNSNLVSTLT